MFDLDGWVMRFAAQAAPGDAAHRADAGRLHAGQVRSGASQLARDFSPILRALESSKILSTDSSTSSGMSRPSRPHSQRRVCTPLRPPSRSRSHGRAREPAVPPCGTPSHRGIQPLGRMEGWLMSCVTNCTASDFCGEIPQCCAAHHFSSGASGTVGLLHTAFSTESPHVFHRRGLLFHRFSTGNSTATKKPKLSEGWSLGQSKVEN